MENRYRSDGICFSYPADWELREERAEGRISIDLAGPATASCSVVLLPECPEPEPVVEAVVEAFQDEYEDIDRYEVQGEIARRPSIGCDLDFFCLELCNSASVRAFRTDRYTTLLMCQANSGDLDSARDAFSQICRSIDCDGGLLHDR